LSAARNDVTVLKRAAGLLAVALVLIFLPFAFGAKTLLSSARDVSSVYPQGARGDSAGPHVLKAPDAGASGWQTEPMFAIAHREIFLGHDLPAWNPYSGMGAPLAANMQAQPYYPISFLYIMAPSPYTYNLWVLLRLFVAGFGMYAFLRWHVGFLPALLGGVSTMLAGYYIIHYDMPHLSVDVMVPAMLFCVEYALRKPGPKSLVLTFAVSFSAVTGGMPESTMLAFTLAGLYFVFAVLLRRHQAVETRPGAVTFVCGTILGIAGSAIVILPFLEYWGVSYNQHDPGSGARALPGLLKDELSVTIAQYIAPLLVGPTRNNIFQGFEGNSGLRGYFGVSIVFLFLVAGIDLVYRRLKWRPAKTDAILAFFLVATVLIVAKRYGFAGINWIGYLPGLKFVIFPLYDETLLAASVPICAAIGLEMLISGKMRLWTVVAGGAALLVAITAIQLTLGPQLATAVHTEYYEWAMGTAVVALLISVAIGFGFTGDQLPQRMRAALAPAAVLLVAAEMSLNYIVPLFYVSNPEPNVRTDPYAGAPYVAYLQSVSPPQRSRVLGKDNFLFPNWPGAFGLAGISNLDALYYTRLMPWIQAFLFHPGQPPDPGIYDRYTGNSNNTFGTPRERRLLQLSSTRYVVGTSVASGADLYEIFKDRLAAVPEFARAQGLAQQLTAWGTTRDAFLLQPPFDLRFSFPVPEEAQGITFDVGMLTEKQPGCVRAASNVHVVFGNGAGATRDLSVGVANGTHWVKRSVDLTKLRGGIINARFAATTSGAGRRCTITLAFADPRFEWPSRAATVSRFQRMPVDDAPVYEFTPVLPRASLFSSVVRKPDAAALGTLTDPAFDIFSRAVVDAGAAGDETLRSLETATPARVQAATISRYDATVVVVAAKTERAALLMLNDVNFPGWMATVDGAVTPIITTDYLFRGVLLRPGNHEVIFRYDPQSQRIGAIISMLSVIATAILALALARSRALRQEAEVAVVNVVSP
jgi:hypothetical protein